MKNRFAKMSFGLRRVLFVACLTGTVLGIPSNGVSPFLCLKQGHAGETFTDEKKAGALYQLQGEYLGVVESWEGNWGAQVIATGVDQVEVHLLQGGLPGAGCKHSKPDKILKAKIDLQKEKGTGTGEGYSIEIQKGELRILAGANPTATKDESAADKPLGILTKIVRESKTLGAKPPENAEGKVVLLYDGGDNNDFKNAKKGELGLGVGGVTNTKFSDHKLHIEFRTPFQPTDFGQARGNSGVYMQGRYELQVLDSFGLTGEDNECGGIYKIAKPKWNMCYPPLTWQTYDIDFTSAKYSADGKKTANARVRILHNGVVIHEDLELKNGTPGYMPDGVGPAPLFLQDHGNPVEYRNIWAVIQAN